MESARAADMTLEPRHQEEYGDRLTEAALRVIVDLAQVLRSFEDCFVLVGGWIPELLLGGTDERHVGSIDVDLALDADKLSEGRYAALVDAILQTRRYRQSEEPFRLYAEVDLHDDLPPVRVDVDFLKSPQAKTRKNRPKLTSNFRPLDASGCQAAFQHPELVIRTGRMIQGQSNTVQFRAVSLPGFLIMKSYALANRDKPKDAYDICFCLANYPNGIEALATDWNARRSEPDIQNAISFLKEKFATINTYGPRQVVEFYNSSDAEEREIQARRAYELVARLLSLVALGHADA